MSFTKIDEFPLFLISVRLSALILKYRVLAPSLLGATWLQDGTGNGPCLASDHPPPQLQDEAN